METSSSPVIMLPTSKGTTLIPAEDIVRIQSISNYSKLFFKNGKSLVVAKLLRWFEEQSSLASFARIHRTHFVNMSFIKSYNHDKNGLLFLHNGETFLVARRKKAVLIQQLTRFNNSLAHTPAGIAISGKKNLAA